MAKDGKDHQFCEYDSCSVLISLSAVNGSVQWESTVKGSPRWGVFDQYGDVKLGTDKDGHYVYAMFNDTGEGGDEAVSIDAGSPYAGCINDGDGSIMHKFEVMTTRVMTSTDCDFGYTYFSRSDPRAVPTSQANTIAQF